MQYLASALCQTGLFKREHESLPEWESCRRHSTRLPQPPTQQAVSATLERNADEYRHSVSAFLLFGFVHSKLKRKKCKIKIKPCGKTSIDSDKNVKFFN